MGKYTVNQMFDAMGHKYLGMNEIGYYRYRCGNCNMSSSRKTLKNIGSNCKKCAQRNDYTKMKRRQTNMNKYGVEYPMQHPDIHKKVVSNSFKKKTYEFPSGRKVFVLGYEPQAIDILLKVYREEDILPEKYKRTFIYEFEGKLRYYHTDIYIQTSDKKLYIEVKSLWTYRIDREKNIAKMQAVKAEGYDIELWILDRNGNILEKLTGANNFISKY